MEKSEEYQSMFSRCALAYDEAMKTPKAFAAVVMKSIQWSGLEAPKMDAFVAACDKYQVPLSDAICATDNQNLAESLAKAAGQDPKRYVFSQKTGRLLDTEDTDQKGK